MHTLEVFLAVVLPFFIAVYSMRWYKSREGSPSDSLRGYPLPPGPPGAWVIGNLLRVPTDRAWLTFTQWKEVYGPLVYLHGLGNSILVLNTQTAISELLDKRAGNYSHRPVFTVAGELMGLDSSMPILPYGSTWKIHRKLAHSVLNSEAVKKYHVIQEDLAALMCHAIMENPQDFFAHIRLTAGRIIMAVTYGLLPQTADDKYITHAEETMEMISRATVPGTYLADMFPSLKYLPSWFPFQNFRKDGFKGRQMIERLVTDPFEHVKAQMQSGTALPSFVHDMLEDQPVASEDGFQDYEEIVKWVGGAMYGAGGESTYATVLTFILAMTISPEVQKKAQHELDVVLGTERFPLIHDRPSLPYVNAVVKETMRWHPVLPLGIPRRSVRDDIYEGTFIPAGTIIMPNVWALASESSKFPINSFIPERFLDESQIIDPHSYAFGFGRRICPGRLLGENNIFILIASILASFDISPPVDSRGNMIPVTPKFSPGLVSYPEPFQCRISPRSAARAALIGYKASSCHI